MSTKTETLAIAGLAIDLTEADPSRAVYCMTGGGYVSITVFSPDGEVDWQQNLYDWSHDEAYLPKLRWLREQLDQMLEERRQVRAQQVAA